VQLETLLAHRRGLVEVALHERQAAEVGRGDGEPALVAELPEKSDAALVELHAACRVAGIGGGRGEPVECLSRAVLIVGRLAQRESLVGERAESLIVALSERDGGRSEQRLCP
jgi:hypothetical protein